MVKSAEFMESRCKFKMGDRVSVQKSSTIIKDLWSMAGTVEGRNQGVYDYDDISYFIRLDTPVHTPVSKIEGIWIKQRYCILYGKP